MIPRTSDQDDKIWLAALNIKSRQNILSERENADLIYLREKEAHAREREAHERKQESEREAHAREREILLLRLQVQNISIGKHEII